MMGLKKESGNWYFISLVFFLKQRNDYFELIYFAGLLYVIIGFLIFGISSIILYCLKNSQV